MRRTVTFIVIFVLLTSGVISLVISCTSEACFDETNAFLKATVYDYATKKNLTIDSLTLYGLGPKSDTIYNKVASVKPVLFPLDASANSCSFVIRINKGVSDTITFRYSSYTHLISKECGYTFYHTLDTLPIIFTTHSIDSIHIEKKIITTVNEENIRIFY